MTKRKNDDVDDEFFIVDEVQLDTTTIVTPELTKHLELEDITRRFFDGKISRQRFQNWFNENF